MTTQAEGAESAEELEMPTHVEDMRSCPGNNAHGGAPVSAVPPLGRAGRGREEETTDAVEGGGMTARVIGLGPLLPRVATILESLAEGLPIGSRRWAKGLRLDAAALRDLDTHLANKTQTCACAEIRGGTRDENGHLVYCRESAQALHARCPDGEACGASDACVGRACDRFQVEG